MKGLTKSFDNDDLMLHLERQAAGTFWDLLGCEVLEAERNTVKIMVNITKHHHNLLGIVHGGVYMSLLDNAMGLLVMLSNIEEKVVTASMNTHFLESATSGKLICSAEFIHRTKRSITLQSQVMDENDKIIAWASGLYRVVRIS